MAQARQSFGVELLCAGGTWQESPAALGSMQLKTMFLTQTITYIEILFLSGAFTALGVRFTGGVAANAEGNGMVQYRPQ